jgi:hypothetical protein
LFFQKYPTPSPFSDSHLCDNPKLHPLQAAAAIRSAVVSVSALPPAPAPRRCTRGCDLTTTVGRSNAACVLEYVLATRALVPSTGTRVLVYLATVANAVHERTSARSSSCDTSTCAFTGCCAHASYTCTPCARAGCARAVAVYCCWLFSYLLCRTNCTVSFDCQKQHVTSRLVRIV